MDRSREHYEYDWRQTGKDSAAARIVRLVGAGKSVLEVGCASGSQTRAFYENGCSVTGLEINERSAVKAQPFCSKLVLGDIESIDLGEVLPAETFEVVVFADVLEHLKDPAAALTKVKPLLEPGGYVVASIPNVTHASVAFELANGRFDYRPVGLLDETHLRFFSKHGVLQLFEDAGFVVERLERVRVAPSATEFQTTPASDADRRLLDHILASNPESLTYQFVLKACVDAEGARRASLAGTVAQARISELEQLAEAQRKDIDKLRPDLAWLEQRLPLRILRAVRRGLGW